MQAVLKREIDPTFTRGYVHIPKLRDKLTWLYGRHPTIRAQYELARALGVSPATLSTWLNGKRYTDTKSIAVVDPDSIPKRHFRNFLDVWGLPEATFRMADLDEFRRALDGGAGERGPWDRMVERLADDARIEIVANLTRGLIDPDEPADDDMPRFRTGDEIMLRVRDRAHRHAVMLLQDRQGWSCLRPTAQHRDTAVEGEIVFPRQSPNAARFARLDETGGVHRVIVVLSKEPMPGEIIAPLLARPMDQALLDHTAASLQARLAAGADAQVMSRRFLVVPAVR